ncbi:TetR/AcrR family transcriptional regulator [Devosia sp. CAU 1758]
MHVLNFVSEIENNHSQGQGKTMGEKDKSFSRSQVLWKTMELFWERGADQTAYADIVRATGASRRALYGWWPEKSELIRDALAVYREGVLDPVLTPLSDGSDPEALKLFWARIEAVVTTGSWRGCFLCRTGSSPLAEDLAVAGMFRAHVGRMEQMIAAMVDEGQRGGNIPKDIEPMIAGQSSAAFIVLMSALAAAGATAIELSRFVDAARWSCGIENTRSG